MNPTYDELLETLKKCRDILKASGHSAELVDFVIQRAEGKL